MIDPAIQQHMIFDQAVREYIQDCIAQKIPRVQILESFNKYIIEEMTKEGASRNE